MSGRQGEHKKAFRSGSVSSEEEEQYSGESSFGEVEAEELLQNQQGQANITSESELYLDDLSLSFKRQLVVDILERGGLDNFSLAKLCDLKKDIYGRPNTKQRRQTQNLIARWKGRGRDEYNRLQFSQQQFLQPISQPSSLRTPPRSTSRQQQQRSLPRSTPNQPKPQSESRRTSYPHSQTRSIRNFNSPPSITGLSSMPISKANPFLDALLANSNYGTFASSALIFVVPSFSQNFSVEMTVDVDSEWPFYGQQFYIYKFTNYVHSGKTVHNGVHIEMQDQDLRFLVGDKDETCYEAWHVPPNKVLVKHPAASYAFLDAACKEVEAKVTSGYKNTCSIQAHNVIRNRILQQRELHFTYTLLVFENLNLGLNNDIFSPMAENGKIDSEVVTTEAVFQVSTKNGVQKLASYRATIMWDIAINEKGTRNVTMAQPRKNELDSKVTKSFDSMMI